MLRGGEGMATALVMGMRRNVGFMFRETGQAMERLGMSMMGDYSYMEPRAWRPLPLPPTPFAAPPLRVALGCPARRWARGWRRWRPLAGAGGGAVGPLAAVPRARSPRAPLSPRRELLQLGADG